MFMLSLALACFTTIRLVLLSLESSLESVFQACLKFCRHAVALFLLVCRTSFLRAKVLDHVNIKQDFVINQVQSCISLNLVTLFLMFL